MNIFQLTSKIKRFLQSEIEELRFNKIASVYNINGYKRIYFIHLRKTGGTSINYMFMSLGQSDYESLYNELSGASNHRLVRDGKIYVGWYGKLINRGNYFYAFSHIPSYKLKHKDDTFVFTCFRDPVERVISHYKMLMYFKNNNIHHSCMEKEGIWLGESFEDFIENIPQEHLMNQLYMFSQEFSVQEAITRVNSLSHYFFIDKFTDGITQLNAKTGLGLEPIHVRKARYVTNISNTSINKLRDKLDKEYDFIEQLKLL